VIFAVIQTELHYDTFFNVCERSIGRCFRINYHRRFSKWVGCQKKLELDLILFFVGTIYAKKKMIRNSW